MEVSAGWTHFVAGPFLSEHMAQSSISMQINHRKWQTSLVPIDDAGCIQRRLEQHRCVEMDHLGGLALMLMDVWHEKSMDSWS